MKLYYCETPNPRMPCAVAKYLGLPTDYIRIDLKKGEQKAPEYLAVNPNGKVPALVDGDAKLFEAPAIMMYQAQQAKSDLWPSAPDEQSQVLQWVSWDRAHFSRHGGSLFFENVIKQRFDLGEPDQNAIEEASGFWRKYALVLDGHLSRRSHLVGDQLTIADFTVAAMLPWARDSQLPLAEFKEVSRWYNQLLEIPAWRDPWPEVA